MQLFGIMSENNKILYSNADRDKALDWALFNIPNGEGYDIVEFIRKESRPVEGVVMPNEVLGGGHYNYSLPKYFAGQIANFMSHNHGILRGKIIRVETHYNKDGKAYHIYSVAPINWERHLHIGEENIRYIDSRREA